LELLTLRWESNPSQPGRIAYFVDDVPVGEDDIGFDSVLDIVRSRGDVKVVLSMRHAGSLGGGSLRDSLPFKARLDELIALTGPDRLGYKFG
jgi:hypothetical protein